MAVVFDSVDYENTGRLIYQNGWIDFFRTGPYREPLYPALIALSMACADLLSTNYQLILKIFQVALLFSTQVLLMHLLRKMNIRDSIIKTAVVYFGFSPAVINAAFSVYYEIVVFPFVVAAVLIIGSVWSDINKKRGYKIILGKAVLFGICFSLLALGRSVFQYVFYFFMFPFYIYSIVLFFRRERGVLSRLVIFVVIACIIFCSAVSYIKAMNLHYNGERIFCRSHLGILLGAAYKRSQPISPRIIASHITSIPGNGLCQLFFSQQECDYADWYGSDQFRVTKVTEIMAGIPKDRQEREVFWLTMRKATEHPFQYTFFSVIEAMKMTFWESTKIGFVDYPKFLAKFYDNPIARFGLRLFFGIITIAALVFVTFRFWRMKSEHFGALFFTWLMIISYTVFYSLCYVLTRYALPIASMYIACISFSANALINREK